MPRLVTVTALLYSLVWVAACQPSAPAVATARQVKSVGYGSVTVYPNYAELTVDADATRPTLKEAVAEVQGVVDQVLALSKRYAPSPNEVRISNTSSNKEFNYTGGKEVFTGFTSTQSIAVRITNLQQLSPYLEELLATRISRIKSLHYGHSQADSLRREAAVLALTDASKTADKMCAALHVRRGPVLQASDGATGDNSPEDGWGRSPSSIELYGKGFGGRGFKMSPELLHFTSVCTLTSAIE